MRVPALLDAMQFVMMLVRHGDEGILAAVDYARTNLSQYAAYP